MHPHHFLETFISLYQGLLVAQMVENPHNAGDRGLILLLGRSLEKGMGSHSSTLAWEFHGQRRWQATVHGVGCRVGRDQRLNTGTSTRALYDVIGSRNVSREKGPWGLCVQYFLFYRWRNWDSQCGYVACSRSLRLKKAMNLGFLYSGLEASFWKNVGVLGKQYDCLLETEAIFHHDGHEYIYVTFIYCCYGSVSFQNVKNQHPFPHLYSCMNFSSAEFCESGCLCFLFISWSHCFSRWIYFSIWNSYLGTSLKMLKNQTVFLFGNFPCTLLCDFSV